MPRSDDVPRFTTALQRYAELVARWAGKLDLVAPGDLPHLWERHIEDSLRALPLLDDLPPGPCVDVGSGAGLPGVPLAIAGDRHWRLLEPRARRAGFLEEVVRALGLDAEVVPLTAEAAAADERYSRAHALAIARALAPPPEALRRLVPLVAPGGLAAVFVGRATKPPPETTVVAPGLATFRVDG